MAFTSGIYEIVNHKNGKRYIGSAVNMPKRWGTHKWALRNDRHDNKHLQAAWDKYGEEVFEFNLIMLCDRAVMKEWEQRYMDEFAPEYNIAPKASHPMLGRKHSMKTRAIMSEKLLGNTRSVGCVRSVSHREAISAAHLGKKRSPEFGRHVSKGKKGKPVAKRGPMGEQQKDAISAAKLAQKLKMTDENRISLSERMHGNTFAHQAKLDRELKETL